MYEYLCESKSNMKDVSEILFNYTLESGRYSRSYCTIKGTFVDSTKLHLTPLNPPVILKGASRKLDMKSK
jgi:hypothetical protein